MNDPTIKKSNDFQLHSWSKEEWPTETLASVCKVTKADGTVEYLEPKGEPLDVSPSKEDKAA